MTALQTLLQTTAALDLMEFKIEPYIAKRGTVEPVAPTTPRVMLHVHQLWGPLLAALKVHILCVC